ncbi:HNH endonuclease signature motif containing protein [Brevibacterium renqingii]|uniref:HNH endonuclease signature motif containing protein n=1 Tax=Brevibacterium renqingii TaxID=2776916 RepID=UPI001ADF09CB|nr:HNH endonuclease signature motif containing protein [Brevibacterium renqingii]
MREPQNPGEDGLDPASNGASSSSQQPLVGPDSPRRLDVDPDSPMAAVVSIARLSTGARIAEFQAVAGLFLAEAVDRLRYGTGEDTYHHTTFTQTVDRFLAARAKSQTDEVEPADPWAALGTALDDRAIDAPDDVDTSAEGQSSEGDRSSEVCHSLPSPSESLPNFPKFRLNRTFNAWVHDLAAREDVAELTAVLGSTTDRAYNEIANAVTLVFGLPKFLERCLNGEFTIEHVLTATQAVKDVAFEYVPRLDDYLGTRRADITMETFRKSLNLRIAALLPVDDRLEVAAKRRRVDITTYPDGTASVTLSGPAVELKAFYLRIEAFARAIRNGNISALTDENIAGIEVGEQDGIAALMFDIATRATPQMTIAVTTHDTTTGETSTEEIPLEVKEQCDPTAPVTAEDVDRAARTAQREAEAAAGAGAGAETIIKLTMPTHGQWVREQAKMMVTVPFLTAVGGSVLPGTFSDGSPLPLDAAKVIAGDCPTWHRILTDPATGTPIDARSRSYCIPADVRAPLIGKWQSCSAPGCTRRAETSEVDHIIPFDHDDPARGGQTTFDNLHPVCRPHHQAKTDRRFSVRMTDDGAVEYAFAHGVVATMHPPDNPISAEHARQVESCAQSDTAPESSGTDGSVLRFTSESEEKRRTGNEDRKARRSRQAQESIWDVRWDPEDPPPF